MSYYPPYKSSSNNIKVELDLTNYGRKTDLKNIRHVDVSSFASKTNLTALKTEVDKIDVDKLMTASVDLAKLTNAVENDLVKKTDYNTKVTSIETQIAGLTKNTVDNLADITKLKAIDTNSFVLKTKLASDVTTLENKIDTVDKKIPDIKNASDILALKNELEKKEYAISENEIGISILVYECNVNSFILNNKKISKWESTGVFNRSDYYSMNGIKDTKSETPILKNDEKMYVYLKGSYFQQNNVLSSNQM